MVINIVILTYDVFQWITNYNWWHWVGHYFPETAIVLYFNYFNLHEPLLAKCQNFCLPFVNLIRFPKIPLWWMFVCSIFILLFPKVISFNCRLLTFDLYIVVPWKTLERESTVIDFLCSFSATIGNVVTRWDKIHADSDISSHWAFRLQTSDKRSGSGTNKKK